MPAGNSGNIAVVYGTRHAHRMKWTELLRDPSPDCHALVGNESGDNRDTKKNYFL